MDYLPEIWWGYGIELNGDTSIPYYIQVDTVSSDIVLNWRLFVRNRTKEENMLSNAWYQLLKRDFEFQELD